MSRWFRGDDFERGRARRDDFDPIVVGERFGLEPAVSLEIWEHVRRELTDSDGQLDQDLARRRFEQLAARVAARGGRLRPAPGKLTLVEADALAISYDASVLIDQVPGKRTLVDVENQRARLRGGVSAGVAAPPQRDEVHALLAGLGLPQPLPEPLRGELEAATGRSLGHVAVHAGAHGNATAAAHDAPAVAIGSDIYLSRALDPVTPAGRELVAHEIAHVVQADASASSTPANPDPVQAAEADADQFAARFAAQGAAADWSPAVGIPGDKPMRAPWKPRDIKADYQGSQPARVYFGLHHVDKFLAAIRTRLTAIALPAPPQLAWVGGPAALAHAFEAALRALGPPELLDQQLPALLHPIDPWRVIDQQRDLDHGRPGEPHDGKAATGPIAWYPSAGQAIAVEVEGCLRASLLRMGLRYVAQAEDSRSPISPGALVTTAPLDRIVADLLCDPALIRYAPTKHGQPKLDTKTPQAFKHGLRFVVYEWLGERDPKLWNWLRAIDPVDATREEIALALYDYGDGEPHSEYAYGLTASPPLFRLPPAWARAFKPAADHAPTATTDDAVDHGALDLAASTLGNDAAIQEANPTVSGPAKPAAHASPDLPALDHTLDQSIGQLRLAKDLLARWGLFELVLPALQWATTRRDHLLATPDHTLRTWRPIIEGQQRVLFGATGDLTEILASTKAIPPDSPAAKPYRDVLRAFAVAMGESQLIATATAQLETARQLKTGLSIALLEMSLREQRDATRDYVAQKPQRTPGDPVQRDPSDLAQQERQNLAAGAIALRATMVRGDTVNPDTVEALAVAAAEVSFRNRTKTLTTRLWELYQLSMTATRNTAMSHLANLFSTDVHQLPGNLARIHAALFAIPTDMDAEIAASLTAGPPPTDAIAAKAHAASVVAARRHAVAAATRRLDAVRAQHRLDTVFQDALGTIHDATVRTMILEIALLIGVSIAGGVAGAAVGGLVRGTILAEAAIDTAAFSRTAIAARWAGAAAGAATDAAVNAAGQHAIFGDDAALSFVENLLTMGLTSAALRPLHRAAATWTKVDQKVVGLWAKTGRWALHGAIASVEMVTGAAAAYVSARILRGERPSEQLAASWALEGASMAVGRLIAGRLTNMQARLGQLAEQGVHLHKRASAQSALAADLEQTGNTQSALHLLDEHIKLLEAEAALLNDPHKLAALHLDPRQLKTLRAGNDQAMADVHARGFDTMKLHFSGLELAAANGTVWSGSRDQIEEAIAAAGSAARNVAHDAAARRWTLELGGRTITLLEVDAPRRNPGPAHGEPGPAHGEPGPAHDDTPPAHLASPWDAAHRQADALDAAHAGNPTRAQRNILSAEIQRQVPDVRLTMAVHEDGARTIICVVTPGGGPTGIKTLNDKLVGKAFVDKLIAARDQIVHQTFAKYGMTVVYTSTKTTTVVSTKPPSEIAGDLCAALADIDVAIRPKMREVFLEGLQDQKQKHRSSAPGSTDHESATARIAAIEATLAKLDRSPGFTFGLQLGAAEIAGGATASYNQILGAEMNATKAAIMARDPALPRPADTDIGDTRGMIYSPEHFLQLARDTMVDRQKLSARTLPWNSGSRPVISPNGEIDVDLARAARKNTIDETAFTPEQRQTVALLKAYMEHVNVLDYMTRFTGQEVGIAARQVEEAIQLVKHLESDRAITKADASKVAETLRGNVAQSRTASEAPFYNRAAASQDRIVINADIKDLGIDVINGNANAMSKIAAGEDINKVSRSASDEIVELKRSILRNFNAFYQNELIPAARAEIAKRHRDDLAGLVDQESQPLILLGGDEITVSLPRAFEELGLVSMVAKHLQTKARSRIAVTRTGETLDGARGHEHAMDAADAPHDSLKIYEQLGRDLRQLSKHLPSGKQKEAGFLSDYLEGLYIFKDNRGNPTVCELGSSTPAGDVREKTERAAALIQEGRAHDNQR